MNWATLPPIGFLLPLCVAAWVAVTSLPENGPDPIAAASVRQGMDDAKGDAVKTNLPPLTDLVSAQAAFADRPLLAEGRKQPTVQPVEQPVIEPSVALPAPPIPETAPVSPLAPDPPRLQAAGLMVLGGQNRILLRNLEDGTEFWASLGDQFNGWTLVEITQVGARLETDGAQVTIKLFEEPLP